MVPRPKTIPKPIWNFRFLKGLIFRECGQIKAFTAGGKILELLYYYELDVR